MPSGSDSFSNTAQEAPVADEDVLQVARKVADALQGAGIPFAVGGALAYFYWGMIRTTRDVDMNVFVGEAAIDKVVHALNAAGGRIDREETVRRVAEGSHAVAWFGDIRVDLFFNSIPLHESAARRVVIAPLLGQETPFLSAEDLILLKLLFFRDKDLVDIPRIVERQGSALDRAYVRHWIVDMMGEDDRRVARWDEICRELPVNVELGRG